MSAPEWMPPLPEPDGYMRHTPVWAEESMRQAQADAARAALEVAAQIIGNDAHAMMFQTLGQYRTALLTAIRAIEVKHD